MEFSEHEVDDTEFEAILKKHCKKTSQECKELWNNERTVANPMPISKPARKKCWNSHCCLEVSWQWAIGKNWCAGDRCVESILGPDANLEQKNECIKKELERYWEQMEREIEEEAKIDIIHPMSPFISTSPTSVQEEFFVDFEYKELLSDEILVHEFYQG